MTIPQVLRSVSKEVYRAQDLHPSWPADPIHGVAVVAEESGEAVRAALRLVYENGSTDDLRKELIQTAAMAVRMLHEMEMQIEAFKAHQGRD